MTRFSTEILGTYGRARALRLSTPHGVCETPMFMPVGTRAGVNNIFPQALKDAGSQMILGGNTYHMCMAPGTAVIEAAGGMHPFMGWDGPMLTDSGGFQVFSLSRSLCTIDELGAHFKSPYTQEFIHMTPEVSLNIQKIIGADIMMAFDQCTPDHCDLDEARHIMTRTHRWLLASIAYHHAHPTSHYGLSQALFGIIQGGRHFELRRESAAFVAAQPLDGIAIGGETVGFDMLNTVSLIRAIHDLLPVHQPRYSMGVGLSPQDLIDVVIEGVDMFDCVAPTRNARHGALYCGTLKRSGDWFVFESEYDQQRLSIKKAIFADDLRPIMADCTCYTCRHYSRAYLHRLFKQKSIGFSALASLHNIHVLHDICAKMRDFILKVTS